MALMSPVGLHHPLAAQQHQQGGPVPTPANMPPGTTPNEVKDNIPANVSEGEFVMPAFAVKFHGLKYMQGLIQKAAEGMHEMDQSGLLKKPPAPAPQSSSPATQPPAPQAQSQSPNAAKGGTSLDLG